MSDKEASLKENDEIFLILSLINKILGSFLYFEMALFTGSENSLLSIRYAFFRISKALVALLKNYSDINRLPDITVSSSSTRVILYVIFLFSEQKVE